MDLHPLNVIIGPRGPVVIDWSGATRGDPNVDVAVAWLLMSTAEIPGGGLAARLLGFGRRWLVSGFVGCFDRESLSDVLRPVVQWKVDDPHMSPSEIASMWRLVEGAESRRGRRRPA